MNAIELGYVALEYGTPSFVFDEGAFAQRMRNVGEIFGSSVKLCFAVKANPFFVPALSKLMHGSKCAARANSTFAVP